MFFCRLRGADTVAFFVDNVALGDVFIEALRLTVLCGLQIANVNNCQTVAEFAHRLRNKCHNELNRRFAVASDKFSSVEKDSVALYVCVWSFQL